MVARRTTSSIMLEDKDKKGSWAPKLVAGMTWRDPGFEQKPLPERHPAVCVSHGDAMAFVAWLSKMTGKTYRLPSEAEWEYAARAVTSASAKSAARFWETTGGLACDHANAADAALAREWRISLAGTPFFPCDDGFPFTAPAGSFRPNAFGLHDMLGNA